MSAKDWLEEIVKAQDGDHKEWVKKGDAIVSRYRDERDANEEFSSKFNILWSNIQTLKPALFNRAPIPYVERRFKDQDPVGREASEILEKAVSYAIDAYDFNGEIEAAVEDRLLPGQGIIRVIYGAEYGEEVTEEGAAPYKPVDYEEVKCQYVYWKDFNVLGYPRRWQEVDAISFRSYLDRDELVDRFGDKGKKVTLDHNPHEDDNDFEGDDGKKGTVYEIWDKKTRKVYWVSPGYAEDAYLDEGPPPLDFVDFWPCPKPLYSTTTSNTMIPVPDYVEYQDQAREIDTLTGRIEHLTEGLKLVGLYAGDNEAVKRMLTEGVENELIPVEEWAAFADRGGIKGLIEWLPIEQILKVMLGLYEAREAAKQVLYEVTGLSDIIRGQGKASETATAQRIKGQYASLRLNQAQGEVARFIRDLIRLQAEVIADQFSPETLEMMTGIQPAKEVMELLRNDLLRGFRIDIETDSTVQADEQADKEARVEFLRASSEFMVNMAPIVAANPEMKELAGKMLLFGVRGFKAGRELESAFESVLEAEEDQEPQEEGPNPEVMKEERASQESQAKMMLEQTKSQGEREDRQAKMQMDAQDKAISHQEEAKRLEQKDIELSLKAREVTLKEAEFALTSQTPEAEPMEADPLEVAKTHQEMALKERDAERQDKELELKFKTSIPAEPEEPESKVIRIERTENGMVGTVESSNGTVRVVEVERTADGLAGVSEELQTEESEQST